MEARRREAAAAYESRKPELEDQIRRMQDALPLYAEQEKKRQAYETLEHQRTALTQNLKKMQNQLAEQAGIDRKMEKRNIIVMVNM